MAPTQGVENINNVNKALEKAHSWHQKVDEHANLHDPPTPSDLPSKQPPFGHNKESAALAALFLDASVVLA